MTEANFKIAASWIVSWEFSVISKDSYITKRMLTNFFCVRRTIRLISFIYIATPKIFRITLSPICLTESCIASFYFLKTGRFQKTFDKIDANIRGFCCRIIRNFLLVIENDQFCSKCHLDELRHKQCSYSKKIIP